MGSMDQAFGDIPTLGALVGVPVVGDTERGPDPAWEAAGRPARFQTLLVPAVVLPGAYALRVVGSLGAPRLKAGEFLVALWGGAVVGGEEVVVKLRSGQILIRQFLNLQSTSVTLQSVNSQERMVLTPSEVAFLHPVIGIYAGSVVERTQYSENL